MNKDDLSLVSVVIPTYNSEKTLAKCLESIRNQTYKNIEIIVVDSFSKDRTVGIAEQFDVDKVIQTKWKLLGARYLGFKESNGNYILMLDSDQILKNKDVVKRAVEIMDKFDMLIFEEFVYTSNSWVQKLFEADRILIHRLSTIHIDPLEGVLLARFYKRDILKKVFKNIPKELYSIVVAHDHAIIYYEAYKITQNVGILPDAVLHIEPKTLIELWEKNYRYGKTTKQLIKTGYYKELVKRKVRFRKGALNFKNFWLGLQSYLLLFLKGVAYQIGYWRG